MRSRRLKRKIISIAVTGILLLTEFPVFSVSDELDDRIAAMEEEEAATQQAISDLERQTRETKDAIAALQGQRAETESNVTNLKNQSSALQSTINGYSNQLDNLNAEISEAENAMAEVSSEIIRLNGELNETRRARDERYELLKKRLKNVYESGGTQGMLRIFFGSGTFQEYLTSAEYLSAIVEYDRKQLAEYRALEESLEEQTAKVEEREEELNAYQDTLDEKHDELADLTDEVRSKLDLTNSSISSEKSKLADYDKKLGDLDARMKALESQVAAAQAELARKVAERLSLRKEDTSGAYTATGSELEWLAATIQAEADGESYTGKLAVGSVIMNRVKSSAFPNSIVGVITQNMQFASYRSGKVELIMGRGPNSTCIRAAEEVLGGARVGDYLFFMTRYYADYYGISEYTMIGNHAFFYRWVTKPKEEAPPAEESAPAEEQPAEEQPAEEQPAEEQPAEEQPSEEQPQEEPQQEGEASEESSSEGENSE